jgi:hypothetical protein
MASFLKRYKEGEHSQVWAELLALGASVREEPVFSEASAVAFETMLRVRANVEVLIDRLHSLGYRFGIYPDGSRTPYYEGPLVPPPPDIKSKIEKVETLVGGPIPISLSIFWRVVGSVDFIGYHPSWPEYSDPLVVYPTEAVDSEYDDWIAACDEDGLEQVGPFAIPLAPDVYHKDNVSGGAPYSIVVPNRAIDATFEDEFHETTFVDYLRIAFGCWGFPGLRSLPKEAKDLTKGLIPI